MGIAMSQARFGGSGLAAGRRRPLRLGELLAAPFIRLCLGHAATTTPVLQ